MIEISVKVEGVDRVKAFLDGRQKQVRYAAAVALTKTASDIKEAMPAELDRALDRPTPFTKRGIFVKRAEARASVLQSVVGFMPKQAAYMLYQIEGGVRQPGANGLRLPSAIKVNDFGNIPRGLIAQLIAVARKEKGLGRVKGRRIRVSNRLTLFYGDPTDVRGRPSPRGIYKEVDLGAGRKQLVPLIVFPKVAAKYKPRFLFRQFAERIVAARWQRNFDDAYVYAIRTAR